MCDINYLSVCSVLGGILLVVSLYGVLWGKSKEHSVNIPSGAQVQSEIPRLESKEEEVASNEPPSLV